MFQKTMMIGLGCALALFACQPAPQTNVSPTITPSPEADQTSTATLQPGTTAQSTSAPLVRIDSGDEALFFGDYDKARNEYQAAFNNTTDRAVQAASLWGLGRTELANNRYQPAVETLAKLTNDYPESTYSARAYFLLGRAYSGLG